MTQVRKFHTGALLSITTRIAFQVPGYEYTLACVYDILGFMCGEEPYTHSLPRFRVEALPYLLDQHPWLRDVTYPPCPAGEDKKQHATDWLQKICAQYGEWFDVEPIPMDDHDILSPEEDLKRLGFKGTIITIDPSEGDNE